MTADPVTIQGSVDVFQAFKVFRSATARRLPVLEERSWRGSSRSTTTSVSLVAEFAAAMTPVAQELRHPG